MKTKDEIIDQITIYKEQLLLAIEEKTYIGLDEAGENDLTILSLIDKLEALLWVIDVELPEIFESQQYSTAFN